MEVSRSSCMLEAERADEGISPRESQYEYLISACLCKVHCRYDGKAKAHPHCEKLYQKGKALLICPEVMGGLGTPRIPSEIIDGRVITQDGRDVTEMFISGAKQAVSMAKSFGIKKAILKESSPSCGVHLVYDGSFSGKKIPGKGITAALLIDAGVKVISDEEI